MEGEIKWRIHSYFEFLAKANASRCLASLLTPEAFELPGDTLPVPEPRASRGEQASKFARRHRYPLGTPRRARSACRIMFTVFCALGAPCVADGNRVTLCGQPRQIARPICLF
jgi:hypothetical protein